MHSLRFSSLDFKLGFRMLARYPGLTLVATAALAAAIALSIIYFGLLRRICGSQSNDSEKFWP
jgi:hypothetical protein